MLLNMLESANTTLMKACKPVVLGIIFLSFCERTLYATILKYFSQSVQRLVQSFGVQPPAHTGSFRAYGRSEKSLRDCGVHCNSKSITILVFCIPHQTLQ